MSARRNKCFCQLPAAILAAPRLSTLEDGKSASVQVEIAKHVQKIKISSEGRTYSASGTWDLLGSVAVRMVPGARLAHCSHGWITPQITFRIEVAA